VSDLPSQSDFILADIVGKGRGVVSGPNSPSDAARVEMAVKMVARIFQCVDEDRKRTSLARARKKSFICFFPGARAEFSRRTGAALGSIPSPSQEVSHQDQRVRTSGGQPRLPAKAFARVEGMIAGRGDLHGVKGPRILIDV
jgi:hypothetical protein